MNLIAAIYGCDKNISFTRIMIEVVIRVTIMNISISRSAVDLYVNDSCCRKMNAARKVGVR